MANSSVSTHVMPADRVQSPRINELIEREREGYDQVLEAAGLLRWKHLYARVELEKRTITAKPFARMLNGRISRVYATSIGVYAIS